VVVMRDRDRDVAAPRRPRMEVVRRASCDRSSSQLVRRIVPAGGPRPPSACASVWVMGNNGVSEIRSPPFGMTPQTTRGVGRITLMRSEACL